MTSLSQRIAISAIAGIIGVHSAFAADMPSEFESDAALFDRLYSYFGGVATFSLARSTAPVHSGDSMMIDIQFQPSFFSVAGVGLGALALHPPELAIPANADHFSVTITSPSEGQLSLFILFREDDNADGIIDLAAGDDEWESPILMLQPGTNVYNIPLTDFFNNGQGSGNGIINVTTTPAMGLVMNLESSANFLGGLITTPTTLIMDHAGFYVGAQQIPSICQGDADTSGTVDFNDITIILSNWLTDYGLATGPGDANADGVVNFNDITAVLSNWLGVCP